MSKVTVHYGNDVRSIAMEENTLLGDAILATGLPLAGPDKHRYYERLLQVADRFHQLGLADVCGKCATGPCASEPAV